MSPPAVAHKPPGPDRHGSPLGPVPARAPLARRGSHPRRRSMKRAVLTLSLLAIGAFLARSAWQAPPKSFVPLSKDVPLRIDPGRVPASHAVVELEVEGMCCSGCAHKLHQRLLAVDGVLLASVDSTTGRASAALKEGEDPERLIEVLAFEKYTARLAAR